MRIEQYKHVVSPFQHQREYFEKRYNEKAWALFWEQGTAKTKPIIDTVSLLYMQGKINGLLVVAPPGVERNWKTDEIPEHMPSSVAQHTIAETFLTAQKNTKTHDRKMKVLLQHEGLSVLLISYEAFMTKKGKKTVFDFLTKRKVFYVLDESHWIKSPKSKRTPSIIASGKYAKYRRILTGTPISLGPQDAYTQVKFLDENFWARKGIKNAYMFRNYFGEYVTLTKRKPDGCGIQSYQKLVSHKNLHILEKWISEIGGRVLKDKALDLPPKLYSKAYVEMTNEQRNVYNELRDKWAYELENGHVVNGELPITRLLRLQQVLCNFIPTGDGEPFQQISPKNPRLDVVENLRDQTAHQGIIWARFRADIDQIMKVLGDKAVRYDGAISDEQAEKNKFAFQKGNAQWFVGTPQKGGAGLTLNTAKTVVYYSNSFRLIDRLQSEDRAHRAGMDNNPVNYIDIICPDTIDKHIVDNLRGKRDIASIILGDEIREWL